MGAVEGFLSTELPPTSNNGMVTICRRVRNPRSINTEPKELLLQKATLQILTWLQEFPAGYQQILIQTSGGSWMLHWCFPDDGQMHHNS